jgi:hypothetical protein
MSIPTSKKPAKLSLPGAALFGGLVSRKYYVMVVLCCVVLYALLLVVPSLLACMHACMHACMNASSLTLPCIIYIIVCQLHGCGGFGTDTLKSRWYIANAVYTCQYTSTSDSHCHDCLLYGNTPISPCCHAFYSRVLAIPWHYDNCALCVYSNSRETSKFVVDGGVMRKSTKMMGSSARIALALLYLIAYVFAGKANKVGRILSSEKDA